MKGVFHLRRHGRLAPIDSKIDESASVMRLGFLLRNSNQSQLTGPSCFVIIKTSAVMPPAAGCQLSLFCFPIPFYPMQVKPETLGRRFRRCRIRISIIAGLCSNKRIHMNPCVSGDRRINLSCNVWNHFSFTRPASTTAACLGTTSGGDRLPITCISSR